MNIDTHATLEQLLDIRDGLANEASHHVEHCGVCQMELREIAELKTQILESADCAPSEQVWERIERYGRSTQSADIAQLKSQPASSVPNELLYAQPAANNSSMSRAIYTLAASILFTGIVGLFIFGQQGSTQQQNAQLQASIQELMLNSRGMELALQKVALQSDSLTSAERSTAERLYWRLALLDQNIQDETRDKQSNPQALETLWNDRIDALNALNQLYYQRQQTLSDSEI